MIIENTRIKERVKKFIHNRKNQIQYKRFDKKSKNKMSDNKQKSFLMTIAHLIHRFLCIVARFIFQNIIYREPGQKVPPVKNLLLLDSASALALKIRTKKVTSVEVVQAFIDRIKVSFCDSFKM
jgi:hypothetical protein